MNNPRDSISETLQGWQVNPPVDPDFRTRVWRRIERPAGTSWPAYLRAHPAAWSLIAFLVIGAAGLTGRTMAQAHVQADREAIVVTYLVDLDPRVQAVLKP
jgi:hypothetical protein